MVSGGPSDEVRDELAAIEALVEEGAAEETDGQGTHSTDEPSAHRPSPAESSPVVTTRHDDPADGSAESEEPFRSAPGDGGVQDGPGVAADQAVDPDQGGAAPDQPVSLDPGDAAG